MEEELDIEELQAILGIDNKSKEIEILLSNENPNPKTFLQAVSIVSNSDQFATTPENTPVPQPEKDEIQNILKNVSLFFSLDNKDKLKIDFSKPAKNIPTEEFEIIFKETKENDQNKNNNKNNQNNMNNNNKDEKKQKQKNKKKKKKEEKLK